MKLKNEIVGLGDSLPVDLDTSVPVSIANKKFDLAILAMVVFFLNTARCFRYIPKNVIGFKVKFDIDFVYKTISKKKGKKSV